MASTASSSGAEQCASCSEGQPLSGCARCVLLALQSTPTLQGEEVDLGSFDEIQELYQLVDQVMGDVDTLLEEPDSEDSVSSAFCFQVSGDVLSSLSGYTNLVTFESPSQYYVTLQGQGDDAEDALYDIIRDIREEAERIFSSYTFIHDFDDREALFSVDFL